MKKTKEVYELLTDLSGLCSKRFQNLREGNEAARANIFPRKTAF